ncbi:hypothetical protein F2Q68_00042908 [Brassica cretica]|uniref:Uncharacterized protein n=1 Tax=Brassica cretica TaxID=69181 RepID=A0A8S9MEQ0_BRACR|nr:hypothetical protein F2Q68_00042908 [Brassica cretica]
MAASPLAFDRPPVNPPPPASVSSDRISASGVAYVLRWSSGFRLRRLCLTLRLLDRNFLFSRWFLATLIRFSMKRWCGLAPLILAFVLFGCSSLEHLVPRELAVLMAASPLAFDRPPVNPPPPASVSSDRISASGVAYVLRWSSGFRLRRLCLTLRNSGNNLKIGEERVVFALPPRVRLPHAF